MRRSLTAALGRLAVTATFGGTTSAAMASVVVAADQRCALVTVALPPFESNDRSQLMTSRPHTPAAVPRAAVSRPIVRRLLAAVLLAVAALVAPAAARAESTNHAVTLQWPGYVDTDLPFADFFNTQHTIAARFMLQYPRAYRGPIVTVGDRTSSYQIGQGDYFSGANGPKLALRVAGKEHLFSLTGAVEGKWHQLAVVRRFQSFYGSPIGSRFELYVDGQRLCPDGESCKDPQFFGSEPSAPNGSVRLGRGITGREGTQQFYGFLDDVAVFSEALSDGEVAALAAKKRLDGSEAGLLRGWTFDKYTPNGSALPAALSHPPAMEQGAHTTIVSPTRNSSADAQLLPPPHLFFSPLLRLPFKTGQVWRVGQGWASGGSHSGASAFALDLSLAGPQSDNKLPNPNAPGDPACGEPVLAAAPGELVYAYDGGGYLDPDDPPDANGVNDDYDAKNNLRVELAPFAHATYMHTFTGSIAAAFPNVELPPWGSSLAVQLGKHLGTVGTRNGCHLHFSIANSTGDLDLNPLNGSPDLPRVTYPAAFFDYRACDADIDADAQLNLDGGKTCTDQANWYDVGYGVPLDGQRLKRVW